MDVVGAIGAINAIIIAFFIYNKKERSLSNKILTIWVIAFALHFSIPFFIERKLFLHDAYWGFILGTVIVSHTPFLFVYTNSLADRNFKLSFRNLWHFGFILIYVVSFIPLLVLGKEKHMELVYERRDLSYHAFLPMITLLFCQIYFLIRTIIVLMKHQYSIKSEFSYEKAIDLAWIKRIVYGFAAIIIASFIAYAMVSAKIISLNTMDYSIIVANMVLFFYMAYSGYSQQTIYKKDVSKISEHGELKAKIHSNKEPKSSNAVKPDADSDQDPKIRELLGLMKQEKPYLNQELTIAELAIQLNLPSHQLSRIIKENTGKNFFVFINDYRLLEFKKLAVNPKNKHISILGLAMEAGFNSKATFNRFFKNATGLTPSEFMESYKF